ncbi:MAG TPA: hypothetical protein VJZ03_02310 [Candidatus Bathyarchaeia archaeon]|nr:hypothetical protein [Candidatus Bathyarchaeia archaeon]
MVTITTPPVIVLVGKGARVCELTLTDVTMEETGDTELMVMVLEP